jgi:hypothetical protein
LNNKLWREKAAVSGLQMVLSFQSRHRLIHQGIPELVAKIKSQRKPEKQIFV